MKKTTRLLSLLLVLVLCLSVLPLSAAASVREGWVPVEGGTYVYYVNGAKVTGWKKNNFSTESGSTTWTKWMYFSSSGAAYVSTTKTINGKSYTFDEDGYLVE